MRLRPNLCTVCAVRTEARPTRPAKPTITATPVEGNPLPPGWTLVRSPTWVAGRQPITGMRDPREGLSACGRRFCAVSRAGKGRCYVRPHEAGACARVVAGLLAIAPGAAAAKPNLAITKLASPPRSATVFGSFTARDKVRVHGKA